MKRLVSHRLEEELLEWAGTYAKSRETSRAVVIEEALRSFRADTQTGVPDLPVPDSPEVRRRRVEKAKPQTRRERAQEAARGAVKPASQIEVPALSSDLLAQRQARLAKEMGWTR